MATERVEPLPNGVQLGLVVVNMLHVGLEHVGSLHVSYTCIESLVSWQLNDYRLSLVFNSSLNLNL